MATLLTGRIIENHVLFFSPNKLRLSDVLFIARSCWPYGNVQQDDQGVRMGAVNYCAKHQVKSCAGSVFQKNNAPIIRCVSNWCGSIGADMTKNDEYYNLWLQTDPATGEPNHRYLEVTQGSINYKVAFPAAYHRKFWERYCKETGRDVLKTDVELENLQRKSFEKFLLEFEKFVHSQPGLVNFTLEDQIDLYYTYYHKKDYQQRSNYERLRQSKKLSELQEKYNFNKKSIPYEHF